MVPTGTRDKYMRKSTLALFAALAILACLLCISCQDSADTADLRVTLDDTSRTLSPKDPDFEISSYFVTCTDTNGESKAQVTSYRTSFVIQGLPIGGYTLTAYGRNAQGEDIVKGSTEFNLSRTNTSATIALSEMIGEGHIDLTFEWDASLTMDPSVLVTLSPRDSKSTDEIVMELTATDGTAVFIQNDLPSGSYTLKAELFDGSVKVAGFVEAVRISDKATVSEVISFNLDELPDSYGQITLKNNAGVPVSCTIDGFPSNWTVAAQEDVTVSLETGSLEEESIKVEWYLDGEKIGTSTQVTFSAEPGQHRLDVVASTDKLGSTGSTSVKFEAALLKSVGQPVLGSIVTTGDQGITLSKDNIVTFLHDGRVAIADNGANKLYICSIVKNSLDVEFSTDLTYDVSHMSALPNDYKVAIADRTTMQLRTFTYNANTPTLVADKSNESFLMQDTGMKWSKVYALMDHAEWSRYEDHMVMVGMVYNSNKADSNHSNAIGYVDYLGDIKNGHGQYLDYSMEDNEFELVTTSPLDDEVILWDNETSQLNAWYYYDNGTGGGAMYIKGDLPGLKPSAICSLPSGDTGVCRVVMAIGDSFRFFEADRDDRMNDTAFHEVTSEAVDRSSLDGSDLDTAFMVLSRDLRFLYAFNSGDSSISTYEVTEDGRLSYVDRTQLDWAASDARISRNGEYMVVTTDEQPEIAIMRIRVSE